MRFFIKELAHGFLHRRHAGHSTYQNHLIYCRGFNAGVLQCLFYRTKRAVNQVAGQLFELCTRKGHYKMFRTAGICSDVREIYFGLHHSGKLNFSFFSGFFKTLQRLTVISQVDALFFLELIRNVINDTFVKIISTKERIPTGGTHLENPIPNIED